MKKKLLLQDLSDFIVQREGISKKEADTFVRAFFEVIEKGLLEDKFVKIKGLGTFKLVAVSDRESVNINTGERFQINGHTKVTFTPDTTMKEMVNRPFAHFETVDLSDDTDTTEFELIDQNIKNELGLCEPNEEEEELEIENSKTSTDSTENEGNTVIESTPHQENIPTHSEEILNETTETIIPLDNQEITSVIENKSTMNVQSAQNSNPEQQTFTDDSCLDPNVVQTIPDTKTDISKEQVPNSEPEEGVKIKDGTETKTEVNDNTYKSEIQTPQPTEQQAISDQQTTPGEPDYTTGINNTNSVSPINHAGNTHHQEGQHTSNTLSYSYHEVPMPPKRNWWKLVVIILGIVMLMGGCYFAGYFKVLCPPCYFPTVQEWFDSEEDIQVAQPIDSITSEPQPAKLVTATLNQPANIKLATDTLSKNTKVSAEKNKSETEKSSLPKTHKVKRGDSLLKISRKYYKSENQVKQIMKLNQLKDADNLPLGMELKLP